MKKILLFALSLLVVVACSKFDDSAIWEELNKHEDRIVKLETLCNQMNTNITSLQTIIIALQSNDYVVNIAPIMEGNKEIGYTITFAKSGSITIYHGKDGENGKDGANGADGKDGQDGKDGVDGQDGKDGYTPKIGVKQHTDGKYYWTLDGDWILDDNNNMIPVTGEDGTDGAAGKDGQDGKDGEDGKDGQDGKDGVNGKDGITPQLKIEDGYWYLSYDNGATWQKLGKATGNNGLDGADGADGEDGDSIIDSITQDDDFVIFTLSDGKVFKIAKYNSDIIQFADYRVKMLCVSNWDTDNDFEISKTEAAAVESIGTVFSNDTDIFLFNELQYFTGLTEIEEEAFSQCESLISVYIPDNVRTIGSKAFWKCKKLKNVSINDGSKLLSIDGGVEKGSSYYESTGAFAYCSSLERIIIPSSLQVIGVGSFYECSALEEVEFKEGASLKAIEGSPNIYQLYYSSGKDNYSYSTFGAFSRTGLKSIKIPASLTVLGPGSFSKSKLETVEFESGIELETISSVEGENDYNVWIACYYDGAFSDCVNLKSVKIPNSIKEIQPSAFKGCTSLETLTFESNSKLEIIGGSFQTMNSCKDLSGAHGAFMNCTSLTSISLPASLTTIEVGAFQGCTSLKSIVFETNSSISYIRGERCTHSGYGCKVGAFKDCKAIEEIKISRSTPPSLNEFAFNNVTTANITLKVPYGSLDAYKAASYWKNMTIKEYYE